MVTPKKPIRIPRTVLGFILILLNTKTLNSTTQMGAMAPTTAPSPLGMYTTDKTLSPLLNEHQNRHPKYLDELMFLWYHFFEQGEIKHIHTSSYKMPEA